MELIDTHCHLTFEQFAAEIEAVIQRSRDAGVVSWVTVGTDLADCEKAVALAERFENLYAAVGIHPHEAKHVRAGTFDRLRELARTVSVVAIGETGLDFHYNFSKRSDQERVFAAQIRMAAELNLPLIVHSRDAFDETLGILERFGQSVNGVVFHCFSGRPDHAERLVELGYYVSFTGVVTFKNADAVRRSAMVVPIERLMLETDCPYMSPEPVRKLKTNEPAFMVHTAELLAELRGVRLEDLAAATTRTARGFFHLPPGRDPAG